MQNYTDTGFKKVRAPGNVFELLSNHWKNNQDMKEKEVWPTGNTYVNYWKSPTYMVNVEDTKLRGAGYNLKRKIWEGVKPILEEWTGMELEPSSMYGVREYTRECSFVMLSVVISFAPATYILTIILLKGVQSCLHTPIECLSLVHASSMWHKMSKKIGPSKFLAGTGLLIT